MTVDAQPKDLRGSPVPGSYSDRFAEQYDDWFAFAAPTTDTVEMLHDLAGAGPVLELGIGTGRVALPLSARGVEVHGVDGSTQMASRLRGRPGGERIEITIGDFSDVPVDGEFSLIYVAAGTFFELPTQESQLGCFASARRRLAPGGVFVLDALLPEVLSSPESANGRVLPTANDDLLLRYRCVHRSRQTYDSHYVITTAEGVHHVRVSFRYAGVGELDLMARIAGLRLRRRYGSWAGTPFNDSSAYHVSVYEIAD
jgi:SAM-dependent methyltransferase